MCRGITSQAWLVASKYSENYWFKNSITVDFLAWHSWSHTITSKFFDHDHLWLHLIVHVVLVMMPALFLGIFIWSLYRLYIAYIVHSSRRLQTAGDPTLPLIPNSLFRFITQYSSRKQLLLSLAALLTLPITYASLELPKQIINNAISTDNFSSYQFFIPLNQIDYLLLLCGFYLIVLLLNSLIKFLLNYYKGSVAEFLTRRLRMYAFKKHRESKDSDQNLIPVIIQEVEPVCGFSGDSFTVPLLQGGTVVTIIIFMMVQNPILGAAAITLLPIQILIIPRFQRKINKLVRQRVLTMRELSNKLDSNKKTKSVETQVFSQLFNNLHSLRMRIYKIKYLMKSLNNFIMNLTPFFFFTIGGYLVIENKLTLGALVASLTSYKDLAGSIRELFTHYQALQDSKTRYHEIYTFLH